MTIRLKKALKNVDPKTRKVIQDEIEKIKEKLLVIAKYRNYNRTVKYID